MHTPISSQLLRELEACCQVRGFSAGEVLRRAGHHYNEMYWLTGGEVDVVFDESGPQALALGVGSPVGEIGFLRGWPATATVTATTPVSALVIDDPTLERVAEDRPDLLAQVMRRLAEVAEDRTSANLVYSTSPSPPRTHATTEPIVVHLCRDEEMVRAAQELRYSVYCDELGRKSPNADHNRRIIADELDRFAHTFIAVQGERTIGTLRGNLPSERSVGAVEEIYGMTASRKHPEHTSICTKFVILREHRGGPAAMRLISAMVRFGLRHEVEECYIDCVPALLHYYRALGFRITGPKFMHRENGPSYPMVVDVTRHGNRLSQGMKPLGLVRVYLLAQAIRLWGGVVGGQR